MVWGTTERWNEMLEKIHATSCIYHLYTQKFTGCLCVIKMTNLKFIIATLICRVTPLQFLSVTGDHNHCGVSNKSMATNLYNKKLMNKQQ